ncbi:hypothetical protein [Neisseria animaloris]|uniref:hypothetical protein n=1 Tax=Neisseria animaloris TaxID=326522 RepID=UPI000F828652|nr:hypothetical protein [Neisseria animaloris]
MGDGITHSDDQTREMGDVLLANDTLHSRYIDVVKLTEQQMQMTNLESIDHLREATGNDPLLLYVI